MAPADLSLNIEKLKDLAVDVFLIDPTQFHLDLSREDIETWDSLGIVSLAVGIEETFGYHMTPDEAMGITGFRGVVSLLESKGIVFDECSS